MKHDKWTNAAIRENVSASLHGYLIKKYGINGNVVPNSAEIFGCSIHKAAGIYSGSTDATIPMLCRFSDASGISLDEIVMGKDKGNV